MQILRNGQPNMHFRIFVIFLMEKRTCQQRQTQLPNYQTTDVHSAIWWVVCTAVCSTCENIEIRNDFKMGNFANVENNHFPFLIGSVCHITEFQMLNYS